MAEQATITFENVRMRGQKAPCTVTVDIELKDTPTGTQSSYEHFSGGKTLSICAAVYDNKEEMVLGGQCLDDIHVASSLKGNPQWLALYVLWKRWHLNSLHAGTPVQNAFVELTGATGYEDIVAALKEAGIYEMPLADGTMHRYGGPWLAEPLPADVVALARRIINAS